MNYLVLLAFLVLSSGPADAEWIEVAQSEAYSGYRVFADPDTIRPKGELVKMWSLYDYKTRQAGAGLSHLSRRTQQQYDCAEESYRFLEDTLFSGHMASGDEVYAIPHEGKWEPVAPGSVGETLWKLACGKR